MEKVVQEEVNFDNLSEYSSAFPRFACLSLASKSLISFQSWFRVHLPGYDQGQGWCWGICEGARCWHIRRVSRLTPQGAGRGTWLNALPLHQMHCHCNQVDHDYVVEAATMLHKSGCPDLHLLTSQVQIRSLFWHGGEGVIWSFTLDISLSIFNPFFQHKKKQFNWVVNECFLYCTLSGV